MPKHTKILYILLSLFTFTKEQDFLNNLGPNLQNSIRRSLRPLENLGDRITQDVNRQLSGLDHLGEKIQSEVYKGLEPVRAIESVMKVRFGTDGTTIATFSPGGKEIIVRNGNSYTCSGSIDKNSGECSGTLEELKFQKQEDFCFVTSKNIINDWYCIAPNNNFRTISNINGKIVCETAANTPKLVIRADEFDNLCKNTASSVTYKYFTTHPLVHTGYGLTCSGRNPQVCTLSDNLERHGNFQLIVNGY